MSTYPDLSLYINGAWRKSADDLAVLNPATEEEIGRLPIAGQRELDDALDSAARGFAIWRKTAPCERANILRKAAALMRERQEEIATSITAEHGKPLNQARMEVIRGCEFLEWDAGEATRTYGRVIPSAPGCALHRASPADRHRCRVLALELPDEPAVSQDCRSHRCRLLNHIESGRRNTGRCHTHRTGVS